MCVMNNVFNFGKSVFLVKFCNQAFCRQIAQLYTSFLVVKLLRLYNSFGVRPPSQTFKRLVYCQQKFLTNFLRTQPDQRIKFYLGTQRISLLFVIAYKRFSSLHRSNQIFQSPRINGSNRRPHPHPERLQGRRRQHAGVHTRPDGRPVFLQHRLVHRKTHPRIRHLCPKRCRVSIKIKVLKSELCQKLGILIILLVKVLEMKVHIFIYRVF